MDLHVAGFSFRCVRLSWLPGIPLFLTLVGRFDSWGLTELKFYVIFELIRLLVGATSLLYDSIEATSISDRRDISERIASAGIASQAIGGEVRGEEPCWTILWIIIDERKEVLREVDDCLKRIARPTHISKLSVALIFLKLILRDP